MSPASSYLLQTPIVPRLKGAIPLNVNCVGAEDPEELVQDATASAAKMLKNVERAKKKVTAGNITFYCIQHLKSGRRSTGSSVADVYGSGTQLMGRSKLISLEQVAAGSEEAGEEIFTFNDVLSRDEEDPSTKAARSLDWNEFWSGLSKRERAMIEFMIEGNNLRKAARALKCSRSAIQDSKRDLAAKLLDFMGTDILIELRRLPRWKDDLEAIREKMECKEQRPHLYSSVNGIRHTWSHKKRSDQPPSLLDLS